MIYQVKIKRRKNFAPINFNDVIYFFCVCAHIQLYCNKAICIPLTFQTVHHLSFLVKQKEKILKQWYFSNVEKILYTHRGCLQIIELKFIFSYLFLFSFFPAAWSAGSQFPEPGIEAARSTVKALVLTTGQPRLNFLNANCITLIQYVLLLFK